MTQEWDEYRRQKVRAWLKEVRSAVSKMRAVQNQLRAEADAYDMMRGISYDRDGTKRVIVHGDDIIFAHIMNIRRSVSDLQALDAEYSEKVREAREVFSRLTCHPCATEIMIDHYILGWSWDRVAADVGYVDRRVKQIADDAYIECYLLMPINQRTPTHPAI